MLNRRYRKVPWPLLLVAVAAAVTALVPGAQSLFPTVGEIPSGGPTVSVPAIAAEDLGLLMLPAVGILVVGYTDNLLTARMLAIGTGHRVHKNQEFIALGVSNIGSSAVGGFPVSSSASRAVIARAAGARTQMYSLISAALVLAILLGLGFLLSFFPLAALSGLIIFAAVSLIDVPEFTRLWSFRRREFALALLATVGVLAFGLLNGIAIAIAVSVIDLLTRVARPHAAVLGTVDRRPRMAQCCRLPERARRTWTAGLPVRLTVVLRECRRLPQARPSRTGQQPRCSLDVGERGSRQRSGHHRPRLLGGVAR